ncbi:MAG: hypothetical protein D6736_01910 [Nitrospinota bacterium]|nr:MAG: hypothetical protein D6736_01910 [Nitrospinota bacterium]
MWQQWTTFVLGLWLIVAPFTFQYTGTARWNDVVLGVLIVILAYWGAMQQSTSQIREQPEHVGHH